MFGGDLNHDISAPGLSGHDRSLDAEPADAATTSAAAVAVSYPEEDASDSP